MNSCILKWLGPKIQVVGVGACDHLQLASEALAAIANAHVVIAAQHHFDRIRNLTLTDTVNFRLFPKPFFQLLSILEEHQGQRIVILASGDPLFFGIGAWLNKKVGAENCRYFTNVSSVQAAFALLGKPWEKARVVSLHGRPLESLRSQLVANTTYAILTDEKNTPIELAQEMVALGFGDTKLWVLESLGQPHQRTQYFTCHELYRKTSQRVDSDVVPLFSPLNICVMETKGEGRFLPSFPGIADEQFSDHAKNADPKATQSHRGMFTKKEVRLAILSLIQPGPGLVGWDVGSGYGSVAVEWARWSEDAEIYAVEANAERLDILNYHRDKFGLMNNLKVVEGIAPDSLAPLPDPDVIYIGGSQGGIAHLLDYCWQRLSDGGRLVVSSVTESTRAQLISHVQQAYGEAKSVEWTEVSIARGDQIAGQLILRPRLPVLLLKLIK